MHQKIKALRPGRAAEEFSPENAAEPLIPKARLAAEYFHHSLSAAGR
jgi:hypothetical protein